ncbi:MAG TPA: tetratricopeptide repeat protein [Terriglobia bacterium]|nr:tetratricopeptide repeat protein [Terriglobia bacterium]
MLSLIGLGLLFSVTALLVRAYHVQQRALGGHWYTRGETDLKAGHPQAALLDFRTALYHASGNSIYQLRLAQALIDSGRLDEARTYLMRLWQSNPADGEVNLELAQVAMRENNVPQIINYFHNAIDGVWPNSSKQRRLQLRQELCEYLIDHNRRTEALAELMALSAATPNDAPLRTQVAELFLKAQDYDTALKEFHTSLQLDPKQAEAWKGAGEAAFASGNYRKARDSLIRALRLAPRDEKATRLLKTTENILQINPFDRRVSAAARRRRVILAFGLGLNRLQECAKILGQPLQASSSSQQTDLQQAYAAAMKMKPQIGEAALRRNPDLADFAMNLVFNIEQITAKQCGSPKGLDLALLLLASKNGGSR